IQFFQADIPYQWVQFYFFRWRIWHKLGFRVGENRMPLLRVFSLCIYLTRECAVCDAFGRIRSTSLFVFIVLTYLKLYNSLLSTFSDPGIVCKVAVFSSRHGR
ncbi:hypothetical protein M758_10G082400, partial [Ceratodon purpureus]